MHKIPIIDISGDSESTIREVDEACREIGFMAIRGHGIDTSTITRLRTVVVDYFSRPLSRKLRDRISRDNYRGYIPQGFFSANCGGFGADRYEGYKLHFEIGTDDPICAQCDLYGPNKWPGDAPGFSEAVLNYWQACDRVATKLLGMLAAILKVERDSILQQFVKPLTNMTLLHYPPQEATATAFGIHPHKDTDALTILVPDKVGGLMVRPRNLRRWLEVDAPDDALVVNIGDLLELWSGGYFVSTPHKVVNKSGADRYSFPYFAVPRFDTVVKPVRAPQPGFDRDSVHVGDVSREVWRTNWPDVTATGSRFDLGTLDD